MIYDQEALLDILQKKTIDKTQREVAKELGISYQYLNDILQGRRNISDNIAKRLGYTRITTIYEDKQYKETK